MSRALDWEKAAAREKARPVPSDPEIVAWWLTLSGRRSACDICNSTIARGEPVAYSHTLKQSVCTLCSDRAGLNPRPSKRYLASVA